MRQKHILSAISSFIGVSQSLPATAYIKMIDVWMIFTMIYPFVVVTLYAIKEVIQKKISSTNEGLYTQYVQELIQVRRRRK